jgi:hypothetical protein
MAFPRWSVGTIIMPQKESQIEQNLIHKLEELKYTYRPDIRDKATLEQNTLLLTLQRPVFTEIEPWVEVDM